VHSRANAVTAMGDTAGATRESHDSFAQRAATRLDGAANTDDAFDGALTRADAINRAGAARLHDIAAQNRATAASATATSPAAQRAILAALRNQMAQANGVLESTQQEVAGIAGETRALGYDVPLTPNRSCLSLVIRSRSATPRSG
jgi:hypothetical protein